MTAAHLDAVCALESACFAHPWTRENLQAEFRNPHSLFLVACEDGAVLGYTGMNVVVDEGYIYNVAVDAPHRRRGVGSALIESLVTYAKKHNLCFLTLEVRESNAAARALYANFGFIKAGERKGYYSDPVENAVLMTKYFV